MDKARLYPKVGPSDLPYENMAKSAVMSDGSTRYKSGRWCGCLTYRIGTLAMAWIGVISAAVQTVKIGINSEAVISRLQDDLDEKWRQGATEDEMQLYQKTIDFLPAIQELVIFFGVLQLLLNVLLLVGTYKRIPSLLLLYVMWSFYPLMALAISFIVICAVTKAWLFGLIIWILVFPLAFYLLWCVYSHYKEIYVENVRIQLAKEANQTEMA